MKNLLISLYLFLSFSCNYEREKETNKPPNVVIVFTDAYVDIPKWEMLVTYLKHKNIKLWLLLKFQCKTSEKFDWNNYERQF